MDKHGEFFPDNPQNIEELIDSLARRAAAAERLMRSLSPQQREELSAADGAGARRRPACAAQLAELTDNLQALRPELNWGRGERMRGRGQLGYGEAAGALGRDRRTSTNCSTSSARSIRAPRSTTSTWRWSSGSSGGRRRDDVRRLRELERELQRQGWVTRDSEGLTLSPKALRRLGRPRWRRVFDDLVAAGSRVSTTCATRARRAT